MDQDFNNRHWETRIQVTADVKSSSSVNKAKLAIIAQVTGVAGSLSQSPIPAPCFLAVPSLLLFSALRQTSKRLHPVDLLVLTSCIFPDGQITQHNELICSLLDSFHAPLPVASAQSNEVNTVILSFLLGTGDRTPSITPDIPKSPDARVSYMQHMPALQTLNHHTSYNENAMQIGVRSYCLRNNDEEKSVCSVLS